MKSCSISKHLKQWALLLRWNKPSGRLILLIPAGWSLWLTPNAPPSISIVLLIIAGGLFTSGAGCIANDLWDRRIDKQVARTKNRPLANEAIPISVAWGLFITMLLLSLLIIFALPTASTSLCLAIALLALPIMLFYPTAKRWFAYPQALLAICWGFAVLIPWAASEASLAGGFPLLFCWGATLIWTFGFDTVYAMADSQEDIKLGLKSSVISLKNNAIKTVSICYALTSILLAFASFKAGVNWFFWPIWAIVSLGMQNESIKLKHSGTQKAKSGNHFKNQVLLGGLLFLGLIIGKVN